MTTPNDNPLLEALALPIPFERLPEYLESNPLAKLEDRELRRDEQERMLARIGSYFVPSSISIEIADAILTSIFVSYAERNPCTVELKRQRYALGAWTGDRTVEALGFQPRNARGITIEGITGLGKSTIVDRVLGLLPQVVVHGRSDAAGWNSQKQLVWIKVDMTSDGSRLGFLMQIYQQVDSALGTDYFVQYSAKKWSIEHHMVAVSKILFNTFCGMLVIEEIQLRNFAEAKSRDLMLLFFLRLANLGVPIVLIGNPLGFIGFERFTQDVRRLTSGGKFELWPAVLPDEPDWTEFLVPGMLAYNVLPEPPMVPNAAELLFHYTGGVPAFLAKIVTEAQLLALRRGKTRLTCREIEEAYESARMTADHRLIRALADRDAVELGRHVDIPHDAFKDRWERRPSQAAGTGHVRAPLGKSLRPVAPRPRFGIVETTYKRKLTTQANQEARATEMRKHLSPDDLRAGGMEDVLLDNFEVLARTEAAKKK